MRGERPDHGQRAGHDQRPAAEAVEQGPDAGTGQAHGKTARHQQQAGLERCEAAKILQAARTEVDNRLKRCEKVAKVSFWLSLFLQLI